MLGGGPDRGSMCTAAALLSLSDRYNHEVDALNIVSGTLLVRTGPASSPHASPVWSLPARYRPNHTGILR